MTLKGQPLDLFEFDLDSTGAELTLCGRWLYGEGANESVLRGMDSTRSEMYYFFASTLYAGDHQMTV